MTYTKMPSQLDLGRHVTSTIGWLLSISRDAQLADMFAHTGLRKVMGLQIPDWQRGSTWTRKQQIRLIESLWLGVPIGTMSVNLVSNSAQYDCLVIDGQQRLTAIEAYLKDSFPVFGYHHSELSREDTVRFKMAKFPRFETSSTSEDYLRSYYNLLNFGGTPHNEDERA